MRVWETATGVGSTNNKDSSFASILWRNKRTSVADTYTRSTPPGHQGVPVNEHGHDHVKQQFWLIQALWLFAHLPDSFFWFIYWVEHWKKLHF